LSLYLRASGGPPIEPLRHPLHRPFGSAPSRPPPGPDPGADPPAPPLPIAPGGFYGSLDSPVAPLCPMPRQERGKFVGTTEGLPSPPMGATTPRPRASRGIGRRRRASLAFLVSRQDTRGHTVAPGRNRGHRQQRTRDGHR
jgi:hypothetical protein